MVNNVNGMFYATSYHPIQAGSIDGTDITAHDNGVYRALLASATGLYDPLGDLKVEGDPYCSLFVGRLSALTDENSLRLAMSTYGRVKNLRLVRHIVTGASCGYAFVEFESEKDMRVAYEQAHLSKLDGATILVDYNRQQLMSGWIPRRLGGGLGGKKESGQLRFGGRDRPFRAPLRPIPHEELRKLGIPLPPEGRYMTWFQVPPIPQRRQSTTGEYDGSSKIKQHRGDEYESRVKEKDASEAEEARERDRHRPRRDEFSDRKHRSDPEPSSKYEGHYEVEPRRPDSRDEEKRSRRREQSLEYDDEDRKRHRNERRYHTEQRGPDPEPSRSSRRNAESDGRHRESSRYRSENESEKKHRHSESERKHRHSESERKHRHGESKDESHEKKHRHGESKHRHSESKHHRHRDREEAGSPSHEDHEGKRHKKHKRVSRGREEKEQTSRA